MDYDTGEIWQNVRFESMMESDHIHRRNSNSRTIKIVWKPCCNLSPAGGQCSIHGISSYRRSDVIKLLAPYNYTISYIYTDIFSQWRHSQENGEPSHYILELTSD